MRILYIRRASYRHTWRDALLRPFRGVPLRGQDGFFEASLWHAFPGTVACSLDQALAMGVRVDDEFDWVVLNAKAHAEPRLSTRIVLPWLRTLTRCRKALFMNAAKAGGVFPEAELQPYDVIFKREKLRDPAVYLALLSAPIVARMRTTMLSCPLVEVWRGRGNALRCVSHAREPDPARHRHDVSFAGADSHPVRRAALKALTGAGFGVTGGLYGADGQPLAWDGPSCALMRRRAYVELIRSSRINLALNGLGEFTFRHLELWALGAFCLSSEGIRAVTLPVATPVEGVHYAAFSSPEDLVEKVRYYLAHEEERNRIAAGGRRLFDQIYSFARHGEEIREALLAHMEVR